MGDFWAGLTRGIVEPQLQARRAIQSLALQQVLNPDLDPTVRAQFAALLQDTPYADLARIQFPADPAQRLQREFAPTLAALSAAGTLFPALGEEEAQTAAERIEQITGFRFPRVTEPGPVLQPAVPAMTIPGGVARAEGVPTRVPAQPEVRGPARTRVDVSRYRPTQIMVELAPYGRLPASELVKLVGEEGMRQLLLSPGSAARIRVPGLGWMTAAEAAKAIGAEGVRNILGIRPPAEPTDEEARRRRTAAQAAYNAHLQRNPDDQVGAYNAAFAVDPTFPTPATLPARPAPLSPQQEAWQTFFTGGWDVLTAPQQQYITSQLQQDDELGTALRTVSTYIGVDPNTLTPAQKALLSQGEAVVAERLGVPVEQMQQAPMNVWQRLRFLFTGKGGPTVLPPGGTPVDSRTWANRQLENFRATGANVLGHTPTTRQDFRRLFNIARRDQRYSAVPRDYWRTLLTLIEAMK